MTLPQVRRVQHQDWQNPKWNFKDLKMTSNTGGIETDYLGWLKPLDATASDEDIRRELETTGVVHVKGVMPRDLVLKMRERYFEHLRPSGLLKEGTEAVDGIFCGGNPDDFVGPDNAAYLDRKPEDTKHLDLALEVYQSEWAREFASNEHLMSMVQRITEWNDPIVFRRLLLRSNMPAAKGTPTGVHYDHIFLRGGPPTALTAWVPIGDCGPMNGGLMYLEDSMRLAMAIEDDFTRMGKEKGFTQEEALSAFNSNMTRQGMLTCNAGEFARESGRKWLIGDYEAGDAVFHHSFMIHASTGNNDPKGRIRLSADLRFSDRNIPHDERWNQYVKDEIQLNIRRTFFPGDGL